jgi:hypothetical protein
VFESPLAEEGKVHRSEFQTILFVSKNMELII